MKSLSPQQLYKYDWRMELFLKKLKAEEPFELMDGSSATFVFDYDTYNSIQSKSNQKITFTTNEGKIVYLSHIAKTEEFGGGNANLNRENTQIEQLSEMIKSFGSVKIDHDNITYQVVDCVSTPGTPKSDFHFISENGDPCIWISHKHGSDPTHFQQWGGLSERKEPLIHAHNEVQTFIEDVSKEYPEGLPPKTSLYRKIDDENLKMMSVYGNEYMTGIQGEQNVSYVVQGNIQIKDRKINSHLVHPNGTQIKYSYEPVLTATYKGDRNDCGVINTRLGINPIGSRRMKEI